MGNKYFLIILLIASLTLQAQDTTISISKEHVEKEFDARSLAIGREMTDQEKEQVVRNMVYDEVLLREAIKLDLHLKDKEVRRRLITLMDYVYEPRIKDPEEDELKRYFESNRSRFAIPVKFSFDHLYFKERPELSLRELNEAPNWEDLGSPHWIQKKISDKTSAEIKMFLGPEIAENLPSMSANEWYGPFESSIGYHFIRVKNRSHGVLRTYEEVDRRYVLAAWRTDQKEIQYEKELEELIKSYSLDIPDDYN